MKSYTFIKLSLSFILFEVSIILAYAFYYNLFYLTPIPITNHISFDAKLKFVREHIDPDKIDTIVLGSSIGLNNILTEELIKNSKNIKYAVNMSVYESSTLQVEQLLELIEAFPNLKRVIYSVQYSDTPSGRKFKNYQPQKLVRYMRHELNIFEYLILLLESCNNMQFCYERRKTWVHKHEQKNKFTSLVFDKGGSVPLYIYGKDVIQSRWNHPHPGVIANASIIAIGRMADKLFHKNTKFYIVHQPYRKGLYDKYKEVRGAIAYFDKRVEQILQNKKNAFLIKTQHLGLHGNKYFADRTHLNVDGSKAVSKYVAKQIDTLESKHE